MINDESVEVVHEYKYLGTIIDDKLCGAAKVERICKKAGQRMYFLRKLNTLKVDTTVKTQFYSSIIQSVVTFCTIRYFGNITKCNQNRLEKINRLALRLGCINLK